MNDERDEMLNPPAEREFERATDPATDPAFGAEIAAEIRRFAAEEAEAPASSGSGSEEDGHADPADLAAYRDGRLPERQAAAIRAHLLGCRECGELLLDLDAWVRGELGSELPRPSEFEIAAAWKGVRDADRGGASSASSVSAARRLPSRGAAAQAPALRWRRAPLALAAAGLIAAIGLSVQNAALRRELGVLSAPTINAPVADLAATPERGEAGEPTVVSLPPGTAVFTVVLAPPASAPAGPVAVEIAAEPKAGEAAGRRLWSAEGLTPNGGLSYTLALPRRSLDGENAVVIRLLASEDRHPIAVYHLKIASL